MFKSTEARGHDLVAELKQHVESFHEGLDRLHDRLTHRQEVVESRLVVLEDEHDKVREGLHSIEDLRNRG